MSYPNRLYLTHFLRNPFTILRPNFIHTSAHTPNERLAYYWIYLRIGYPLDVFHVIRENWLGGQDPIMPNFEQFSVPFRNYKLIITKLLDNFSHFPYQPIIELDDGNIYFGHPPIGKNHGFLCIFPAYPLNLALGQAWVTTSLEGS